MSRNIVLGLKSVGGYCPYLQRVSPSGLKFLTSTNKLNLLVNQCPAMSFALSKKSFSTSSLSASPSSTDSKQQQQARGYASIVPEPSTSTSASSGLPIKVVSGRATALPNSSTSNVKDILTSKDVMDKVFPSGRPTAALGFAKHETTPATPSLFNYEEFYNEQLDKKHKDKSYRVSCILFNYFRCIKS